jgi:tetratricopeptide (TPR) repeat protein
MIMRHIALFVAGAAVAVMLAATPSRAADELTEISVLVQQGNNAKALERIEAFLAINPRDTRARFMKGVILTGLGKNTEAIRMFSILTKDFPELPEPYNNLAVLYAMQGDYDRARATLETALRKNPGYAIAYENLGDLHAKLATQAYEQARQLDKANMSAQAKLDALRGVLKGVPLGGAENAQAAKPAAVATAPPAPAPPAAAPAAGAPAKSAPVAAPPAAPAPAKSAPIAATSAAPASATTAPEPPKAAVAAAPRSAASTPASEVIGTLDNWARAWSSKDATAYLALYAPGFRVPGNVPRAKWEALRRALIDKPKKIEVSISEPKVTMNGANRATVSFRQHYRSDNRDDNDNKTIEMVRADGKWQIVEESVAK